MVESSKSHDLHRAGPRTWTCHVCGWQWGSKPRTACPGLPREDKPTADLLTVGQLRDRGLLKPVAATACYLSGKDYELLYPLAEAQPDPAPRADGVHRVQPIDGKDGWVRCIFCEKAYYLQSWGSCPGVKVYAYDKWPEGFGTERQLKAKRLIPGPVRGAVWYQSKREDGHWLYLYAEAEATPKPAFTEAQMAAKARAKATALANRTCQCCGRVRPYKLGVGLCGDCRREGEIIQWARNLLTCDFVLLDFETTGTGLGAEIIQIGVMGSAGRVLLDTYVKPQLPIDETTYDSGAAEDEPWRDRAGTTAFGINGISNAMVADAPTFPEVYERLREALEGKVVVAYNAEFERGMLSSNRRRRMLPKIEIAAWECAMESYAPYAGEWRSQSRSWKWQSLGRACLDMGVRMGDHTGAGDCAATLALIQALARQELPQVKSPVNVVFGSSEYLPKIAAQEAQASK